MEGDQAEAALDAGDVHVWAAELDRPTVEVHRLAASLSADEVIRAVRFRSGRDRGRFIVGRGFLRDVLARYCGAAPGQLEFRYGAHGKPWLPDARGLRFNLSHAGGRALCAVTRGRELGVDIERVRELDGLDGLSASVFSLGELQAWRSLHPRERPAAFFRCWTRKEAFVKAVGEGLSCALTTFDVTSAPGEPPRLLPVMGDRGRAGRFGLHDLEMGEEHVAALAVEGTIERLVWRPW
jgi:4'-phosphopantetheinyl transferase